MTAPDDATVTVRWIRADARADAVPAVAVRENGVALVVALGTAEAAVALEAARAGQTPRLSVDADELIELPPDFDEPLALLAVDLAAARAALDGVASAEAVVLAPYGPRAALLHVELAARDPRARVLVLDPSSLRRTIAAAFGAEAREPGAADRDGLVAADAAAPTRTQIADALAAIAATPWRYRPVLTSVATLAAGEELPDDQAELATALLL
jgi:hypothetical protein